MKPINQSLPAAMMVAAFAAPAAPALAQHADHSLIAQAPSAAKASETGQFPNQFSQGSADEVPNMRTIVKSFPLKWGIYKGAPPPCSMIVKSFPLKWGIYRGLSFDNAPPCSVFP